MGRNPVKTHGKKQGVQPIGAQFEKKGRKELLTKLENGASRGTLPKQEELSQEDSQKCIKTIPTKRSEQNYEKKGKPCGEKKKIRNRRAGFL